MITFFITWTAENPAARVTDADAATLAAILRTLAGLTAARIYTPAAAHDPYLDDGPPPPLVLQLHFADIADLETAASATGALQSLGAATMLPSLHGATVTQQAMLARPFAVDPGPKLPDPCCTYLVTYTGEADDANAWLTYYIAHHPPIMRRFPGIREIEICTRLDWCSALPFARVAYLQRNKVVFDSAEALNAALNSPIRHEMRADFHRFPPYRGGNTHYPMVTHTITV